MQLHQTQAYSTIVENDEPNEIFVPLKATRNVVISKVQMRQTEKRNSQQLNRILAIQKVNPNFNELT